MQTQRGGWGAGLGGWRGAGGHEQGYVKRSRGKCGFHSGCKAKPPEGLSREGECRGEAGHDF